MRYFPTAYIGLFFSLLVAGFCLLGVPVFGDADTAWHLAAGDLIRAQHSIPAADPWSFTSDGQAWYNLSWLFDVILSACFSLGGFSAVYVLTLALFAGSVAAMAAYAVRRGASLTLTALVLALVMLAIAPGVIARPNAVSLVLAVVFYIALQRYRDAKKIACLFILPPLAALWANIHGGFLLAFLLLGVFLIDALVHERKTLRGYAFIIALCFAATLLNPYGYTVYLAAYQSLHGAFDQQFIHEWQAMEFSHDLPMTVLGALLIAVFLYTLPSKKIALADKLLVAILVYMSVSSMRHSIIAAVLLLPYMALQLTAFYGSKLKKFDEKMLAFMHEDGIKLLAAWLVCITLGMVVSPYPNTRIVAEKPGFSADQYPFMEAEFIEQNYPALRFYNSYDLGGYLDYLWRGRVKTFVDGRASSLFSAQLLADSAAFAAGLRSGATAELADKYQLGGMILSNNEAQNFMQYGVSELWQPVFYGPVATVFLHKGTVQ